MEKFSLITLLVLAGVIYLAHQQVEKNAKLWVALFNYEKELALKDREIEELKNELENKKSWPKK